jgi:hypothetical protein
MIIDDEYHWSASMSDYLDDNLKQFYISVCVIRKYLGGYQQE